MKNRNVEGRPSPASKPYGILGGLAVCAVIFLAMAVSARPTVYEKRVINYQPVDLLPLFVWWENPKGTRPLTSWKHVEGSLERETMYGWLIRGTIEGQNGLQYFLLKNPPRKELARYRELENSLPRLQQQRAALLPVATLPAYKTYNLNRYAGTDPSIDGGAVTLPSEDFDKIDQAKNDLQQVDGQIQAAREEMAGMLDRRGFFKVDAFALQMNQQYQGSQVFDFGFPSY
jgi:hypothetical protein